MPQIEHLISLWLFLAFMIGTPGPANLLIMTAGAAYGFRACMRFNLGLITGKIMLNLLIGLGAGILLQRYELLNLSLKIISAGFMIYLSLASWNSQQQPDANKPFTYAKGLIVHPLNPKAWVMCLLAWTDFAPNLGTITTQTITIVLSFALMQLFFHSLWCFAGHKLGDAFKNSVLLSRSLIILTIAVVLTVIII